MSKKLIKTEVDSLVKKSLNNLEPDNITTHSGHVRPYAELIGTFYIASRNPLVRILKKPLSLSVKVHRRIFQGYYEQQTMVDSYVYEELRSIGGQLERISVGQLEDHINDSINHKLDEKIQETHVLIDRFKKEINYELVELRKGTKISGMADRDEFKTQILHPERVKKLDKVNVGAGMDIRDDYINLDHRALEGIDVVADVLDMPFREGTLQEVFTSHVVEHFVQKDLEKILQYWFALLKKGGSLRIITPNIEDMAKKYAVGEVSWEEFRSVALGGQDYASDYHYNHFSIQSMQALISRVLPEAKFSVVAASRRNGECFEMEVLVTR